MKKYTKVLIGIVIVLLICFGIGRINNRNKSIKNEQNNNVVIENNQQEENQDAIQNVETQEEKSSIWNYVSYEGHVETTDNPWGMTAGTFDMEGESTCAFLTPNTAVILNNVNATETLKFSYKIHPWMQETSDGVGFIIWLLDGNDTILSTSDFYVTNENKWMDCQIDMVSYPDVRKVKILCNNGKNNDDSGDWLIIRKIMYNISEESNNMANEDSEQESSIEIPDKFDANDDWETSSISSQDFILGSYPIEGEASNRYAWIAEEMSVCLKNNEDTDKIVIEGYIPMDMYQNVGIENLVLTFYMDETVLVEKKFETAEVFQIELDKTNLKLGENISN